MEVDLKWRILFVTACCFKGLFHNVQQAPLTLENQRCFTETFCQNFSIIFNLYQSDQCHSNQNNQIQTKMHINWF